MAAKRRGLGRGLDALLGGGQQSGGGNAKPEASTAAPEKRVDRTDGVHALPVDLIGRGRYQPRRDFDQVKLQELADSIAAQGVVQPIVVRPAKGGRYEIIAGERRWRAAQLAGLHEIPVVVRDVSDQQAMAVALIENIQRDDLNPLEEAGALRRLLDEFGLTHQQIAEAVGKSRATVTNMLRLLDLSDEVKGFIDAGRLEMGHARALLGLKGGAQTRAAREVVDQGLSVRATEQLVRRLQGEESAAEPAATRKKTQTLDPDVHRLQEHLSEKLGARVQIQRGKSGKGKLVISYTSLDELDGIIDHIH
ncbi:MAG TPA: ParB/RepB/Spo0J family partition protein [Chromatiaceae bacterium]|nr:ParB/RepB/Spo0J family partition protein [Chromatiaceae bacterium]